MSASGRCKNTGRLETFAEIHFGTGLWQSTGRLETFAEIHFGTGLWQSTGRLETFAEIHFGTGSVAKHRAPEINFGQHARR
jgi:hypothetical protein